MTGSFVAFKSGLGMRNVPAIVIGTLTLGGCASLTPQPLDLDTGTTKRTPVPINASSRGAAPPATARYKVGAPYQAGGLWYVPAEQPDYDEVGLASWYGDAFDGKATANGEIFNMNGVSAAHATLPLPSIVEVTNLENGRTLKIRLNDRGPFHPGRIIDLSRGAAQQLGFYQKGTAKVRVRYLGAAPMDGFSEGPMTTVAANRMHSLLPPLALAPTTASTPTARVLGATTPVAVGGLFSVQVGAFANRDNAMKAAAQLGRAGRTSIKPLERSGSRIYRVLVGSWASAEEAGSARARVIALGFAQARVVSGS
jgi:rare lipoprotein A